MSYVFSPPPVVSLPIAGTDARFPVRRILCMGRNYIDHVREMGRDPERDTPFFFSKPTDSLIESGATISYPLLTKNFHHEGELVVAIGKGGTNIAPADANSHIFGYACGNDLTRRDLQFSARDSGQPWEIGKAFDNSAVCAPIHRVEDVGILDDVRLSLSVNGDRKQSASVADMIYSVPGIIAMLSRSVKLLPGDLIYTGTPAGVGPLVPGDTCIVEIEGLSPATVTISR